MFKDMGRVTLWFILAIILLGGIGGAASLGWMKVFGTKIESAKTDIYRENKSYVEGTIRDLRKLRVQYEAASPDQKSGLRTIIMQRAGELDWDRLPSDVRRFLEDL